MKKLILKWLGLYHVAQSGEMVSSFASYDKKMEKLKSMQELNDIDVVKLKNDVDKRINELFLLQYHEALTFAKNEKEIADLSESLDNRRNEIDGIIETLQNLDNHEVIADLHKRISELENKSKVAK